MHTLKAKYYPETKFLRAKLGHLPSFTWKSIWASKGVLKDGLCWWVGNGAKNFVIDFSWIPSAANGRIQDGERCHESLKVCDLIENTNRIWKEDAI